MSGLSHQTIYRLVKDGRLPASRRAGQLQIRRADVAALIESSRITPGTLMPKRNGTRTFGIDQRGQ